jgi:hypothetical protein
VSTRSPWLRKQVGLYEVLSLAAVLAFTGSSSARAEEGRSSLGARLRSTLSFDVSGGGATSLFGGATDPGRGSLELALHARLPLLIRSGLQLDYTAGVVPVALAFGTRVSGAGLPDGTLRTETVFGAGVDGSGLVAHLGRSNRWQPYVSVVGGVRLFERPVPDPRGIRSTSARISAPEWHSGSRRPTGSQWPSCSTTCRTAASGAPTRASTVST